MTQVLETRNTDLYMAVVAARRKKKFSSTSDYEIDSPLKGRQVIRNGQRYNIEKVLRHWWWGWYVALLLERNESHVLVWWENISCGDEAITDKITLNRQSMTLL